MRGAAAAAAPNADIEDEDEAVKTPDRAADLLGRKNSKLRKYLDTLYDTIHRGWQDQAERADDQMDWWDCYNCTLNQNQFYNGNAEVYVPIVRDAINALVTRITNQLFPASGRYTDATAADGQTPWEVLGLLSHYIRAGKLKTKVFKPLVRNGYIEGQFNLYLDWSEIIRQIVSRETHGPTINQDGTPVELPPEDGEEIDDIGEPETVLEGMPACEVLHDSDVLVLPATADSIDEALEAGGLVVILRRWSKGKIERMAAAKEIRDDEATDLKAMMRAAQQANSTDAERKLVEATGIRAKGGTVHVWEVWHKVPLTDRMAYDEDGERRLCRVWFGPDRMQLGFKRNPFWNDRCPLLSEPVEKISGAFKGRSPVEPIASLQYEANDAANELADADHYSALPIIARDPSENGGPMILNIAAIWDIDPNKVKFMEFPDLGARGLRRIQAATQAIFQSLSVNPAMLPQQTGRPGGKRNQAEIAMEQQVDILTGIEQADVLQEGIATPMLGWYVDLDHQFRDRKLTVRMYGQMGVMAEMEDIGPLRNRHGMLLTWSGTEQTRNIAMQQQWIAWINVARGLRQDMAAEGYRLKIGPVLEKSALSLFGPVTGAQVLEDQRHQLSIPVELENEMLADGFAVPVQPMDDDMAHLKAQQPLIAQTGDPHGTIRIHVAAHLKQAQIKAQMATQAAMQAQRPQGAPGVPGGAGRGVAGAPRMPQQGAMPAGPRQLRAVPGAVRPDNLPGAGALTAPRRA